MGRDESMALASLRSCTCMHGVFLDTSKTGRDPSVSISGILNNRFVSGLLG